MSFRFLATAILIGTFCITLGISIWHRHGAEPTEAPVVLVRPTPTPAVPVTRLASPGGVSELVASAPAAPATPSPSSRAEVILTPSISSIEVPVFVLLRPATDPSVPSAQAATLRNGSAKTLDVSVTASNPVTGREATVQVTLDPFRSVPVDETTFVVEPEDVLQVQSPPFADRRIDPADSAPPLSPSRTPRPDRTVSQ